MENLIEWLKREGNLKIIEDEVDVELEIAHIAYLEMKKENPSPLLFKNVVYKRENIKYDMPLLINLFANKNLTKKILGKDPDTIGKSIDELMKFKPPKSLKDKIKLLPKMWQLRNVFPKRVKQKGISQEIIYLEDEVDLRKLPILKTWEDDGGRFITMGQVYTKSLDGDVQNLGMYRLQEYSKNTLGMHWQIHKDANHFFHQYKKANKKMPVTVVIGGDPLYIWCGQAPMPPNVFELMLYGYIRNKRATLVKSITNDIYIPADGDIVIEGWVDPNEFEIEGPFGDHTGYYTLPEKFPLMRVSAITMKKDPIFVATVVGKPPIEDKYMGWATERIFLPLLKPMAPDLIDYHMPENGVFHNLILAKIKTLYPAQAKQFMHAFWGVGQMSFVKHAIFMDEDAPSLTSYNEVAKYIADRFDKDSIFISYGVVDQLDHASIKCCEGGKVGLDLTHKRKKESTKEKISSKELLEKLQTINSSIKALEIYLQDSPNPIAIVAIDKDRAVREWVDKVDDLSKYISILVVVDSANNDLKNPYMLIWRVVNNIDGQRDIYINDLVIIDATTKDKRDGFFREWPSDVFCTKEVLESLKSRGLISYDQESIYKWGLLPFNKYS